MRHRKLVVSAGVACSLVLSVPPARAQDPLPSWHDASLSKGAITGFVAKVTTAGGRPTSCLLPSASRCSTTTVRCGRNSRSTSSWCSRMDRVKALAPQHPEWKATEPFKPVLDGDRQGTRRGGERALAEMIMATHTGMTTDEFDEIVSDWIATARHPHHQTALTPTWSTSRCSSCWRTCGRTASRRTSSRVAE